MQPNTALLSTILMLGTFFLAYFLKEFRNSIFLGERVRILKTAIIASCVRFTFQIYISLNQLQARRTLGDFGVPIAILTMVLLDYSATDTYTQKIKVPTGFSPSRPEARGWFIDPMGMNESFSMLLAAAAVLPAALVYILVYQKYLGHSEN